VDDIFGARIEIGSGKVLDTNGIPISLAPDDQNYPAVSSYRDQREFFVVWQDARDSVTNQTRLDIYGTRVDESGTVLDPAGIPICTATNSQIVPSVASGSTNLLVVWTDFRKGINSDIYGARIGENGAVLDPDSFAVSAAPNDQSQPKVAFRSFDADERYFVVWTDARSSSTTGLDIYGAHVNASGRVIEMNGIPIRVVPNQQSSAAVAPGGPDFFVLWQEATDRTAKNFNIYATLLTDSEINGVRSASLLAAAPHNQSAPAVRAGLNGLYVTAHQGRTFLTGRTLVNEILLSPLLHHSKRIPEGGFEFMIGGIAGQPFFIQISDDLIHWTNLLSTTINGSDSQVYQDRSSATNASRQFYRAIPAP
jgi:hypothetical protein